MNLNQFKKRYYHLKWVVIISTFILSITLHFSLQAQCIYSPVIAKSYILNNCGDKLLQNLIGVDVPVYGNNGVFYFSSPMTNNIIITDTEEVSLGQLNIYPNPAFDVVNLEWSNDENAEILIFSQLGQLVTKTSIEKYSTSTIDIQHLNPGYYIIKAFTSSNQIFINKLIKQ